MANGWLPTMAGAVLLAAVASAAPAPNRLTPEEKKAGWRLLFDGQTTAGWRGFKKADFPAQDWTVQDGTLTHPAGGTGEAHEGTDIITRDRFSDFDLRFEWRIAPGANSGVKYFVTEERPGPIAHEYQIVDDARHPDARIGAQRQTGAFYDVLPPAPDKVLRAAGEWNESRVLARGAHVEHWLNGRKILEYELGSPELRAAIARSKFKDVPGFGTRLPGHVLLQDHGDEVSFRNVKILATTP